jgi:hypothetical protein
MVRVYRVGRVERYSREFENATASRELMLGQVDVAACFEGTVVHGDDSKTRAGAEWLSLCVEDLGA